MCGGRAWDLKRWLGAWGGGWGRAGAAVGHDQEPQVPPRSATPSRFALRVGGWGAIAGSGSAMPRGMADARPWGGGGWRGREELLYLFESQEEAFAVHTRARTHTHAHTHGHTHARTHARTHTRTHTNTRTDTHTRTHARTHAHTHTRPLTYQIPFMHTLDRPLSHKGPRVSASRSSTSRPTSLSPLFTSLSLFVMFPFVSRDRHIP